MNNSCEDKMQSLTVEWNKRFEELKNDKDSTIIDVLSEGVVLTSVIWSGSRSRLGRKLIQSISGLSKAGALGLSKRISKVSPSFATWLSKYATAGSAELVGNAGATAGAGLVKYSGNLANVTTATRATAGNAGVVQRTKVSRLRNIARIAKVVKVAAAAVTIYEVGSWVYDSFFAGDEATDQDVTSSGDRLASAEGPVATTMTSFVNTAEDAVLWSEYGPTREAVNEIIINGNRALTSNPFDANDKFIENLKLQMHLADLYLDDPVSARQVGLQIMSVGAALYNGTPYAVTNNKVVIPQNDMVGLISSMLLNMSDCSGVLTAASIEEVSATDPSGYATLITDKQSADGMQQYLKHNA